MALDILVVDDEFANIAILGRVKEYAGEGDYSYVRSVQGMVNIQDYAKEVPPHYAEIIEHSFTKNEQKIEAYDPPT